MAQRIASFELCNTQNDYNPITWQIRGQSYKENYTRKSMLRQFGAP